MSWREEINSGVVPAELDLVRPPVDRTSRLSYRDYNRDQTPFGGRDFSQIEVCLDPTSVNAWHQLRNVVRQRALVLRAGRQPSVERSQHRELLDRSDARAIAAGHHTFKAIFGYTEISIVQPVPAALARATSTSTRSPTSRAQRANRHSPRRCGAVAQSQRRRGHLLDPEPAPSAFRTTGMSPTPCS